MMTAASQQAWAEGLRLRLADNETGYFGVHLNRSEQTSRPKFYEAQVRRAGKVVSLGHFATAEEAALIVARSAEEQAAARATVSPWYQDAEGTWHEEWLDVGAGSGEGCDVGDAGGPGWYQDAEGMWHEEEPMQELQAAGLAQLAEEARAQQQQHDRAQAIAQAQQQEQQEQQESTGAFNGALGSSLWDVLHGARAERQAERASPSGLESTGRSGKRSRPGQPARACEEEGVGVRGGLSCGGGARSDEQGASKAAAVPPGVRSQGVICKQEDTVRTGHASGHPP